jgi:hypothetical protein
MPHRIVDGWPGIVVVVYGDCSNTLWLLLKCMAEGESSRTILDRLRLGEMIVLVGCNCN